MGKSIILGRRIYLRNLTIEDAKQIQKICHDKSVHKFTRVPYPYKIKDAFSFIKRGNSKNNTNEIIFGIINKETKELMGTISFVRINKKDNKSEIGYMIGKKFRNKGYVTEAAKLLLEYGFKKFKFNKIYINCAKENEASKKVIKKLGCKKEALLKKDIFVGGKYHDHLINGIFRSDWMRKKCR